MRALHRRLKNARDRKDRGAAVLEFAIALPLFIALMLLIFDAGLGYSASRGSSSAARSAARVGALAGDERLADYRVLDVLRAEFAGNGDPNDTSGARTIVVYKTDPSNPSGEPSQDCLLASVVGVCNHYDASILDSLTPETFATTVLPDGTLTCNSTAPDAKWCPLNRRADAGSFLGVYVSSTYDTTTGFETDEFQLDDRAVFAMYFPPLPEEVPAP